MFAEYQAERAVEDVDPVVAFVGAERRVPRRRSRSGGRTCRTECLRVGGSREMIVDPSPQAMGRRLMRGSPVGGASTSSSRVTPYARASGSSCSSVGRRRPASSLDNVPMEMPVSSARSVRVMSRRARRFLSLGPTASMVRFRWSSTTQVCCSAEEFHSRLVETHHGHQLRPPQRTGRYRTAGGEMTHPPSVPATSVSHARRYR